MITLLLTILILSFAMILAGLWLSAKKPASPPRRMSYAGHPGVRRTRQVGDNRRMQVRRSTMEIERRAWTNIAASLNIGHLFNRHRRHDTPWLGMTLVLLSLLLFGVYFLRLVLPSPVLFALMPDINNTGATTGGGASNTSAQLPYSGASKALMRISQVDPGQYNSPQDYDTWWPSACSAASMTEVINSYGHHYRIADILSVEMQINEITADAGLLHPTGIDRTVARFNFTARWLNHPSVDDLITTANSGTPVIVNFPPDRWSGGHLLVTLGGNKNYVYLADSSRLNMRAMDRKTFLKYWVGFGVVVTPVAQQS